QTAPESGLLLDLPEGGGAVVLARIELALGQRPVAVAWAVDEHDLELIALAPSPHDPAGGEDDRLVGPSAQVSHDRRDLRRAPGRARPCGAAARPCRPRAARRPRRAARHPEPAGAWPPRRRGHRAVTRTACCRAPRRVARATWRAMSSTSRRGCRPRDGPQRA